MPGTHARWYHARLANLRVTIARKLHGHQRWLLVLIADAIQSVIEKIGLRFAFLHY